MIQDQLAEYYALITHLDEQIGRLLQALPDSGELENTIIIFAGDNGLALARTAWWASKTSTSIPWACRYCSSGRACPATSGVTPRCTCSTFSPRFAS